MICVIRNIGYHNYKNSKALSLPYDGGADNTTTNNVNITTTANTTTTNNNNNNNNNNVYLTKRPY